MESKFRARPAGTAGRRARIRRCGERAGKAAIGTTRGGKGSGRCELAGRRGTGARYRMWPNTRRDETHASGIFPLAGTAFERCNAGAHNGRRHPVRSAHPEASRALMVWAGGRVSRRQWGFLLPIVSCPGDDLSRPHFFRGSGTWMFSRFSGKPNSERAMGQLNRCR